MLSLLAFIFGKNFLDPRLRYMLLIFGIGMLIWRVRKALKQQVVLEQAALEQEPAVKPELLSYEEALKLCQEAVQKSGKTYRMDPCPAQIKQALNQLKI